MDQSTLKGIVPLSTKPPSRLSPLISLPCKITPTSTAIAPTKAESQHPKKAKAPDLLRKLPNELLQRILEFIGDDDLTQVNIAAPTPFSTLCRVSRTSKYLQENAERTLYKRMRIQSIDDLTPILSSLERNPARFKIIEEMRLDLDLCLCHRRQGGAPSSFLYHQRNIVLDDLIELLGATTNLKLLVLELNMGPCSMGPEVEGGVEEEAGLFNCLSFYYGVQRVISDNVMNPNKEFLPHLSTLAFSSTSDKYDFDDYVDFLRLPSVREVILENHRSSWYDPQQAALSHSAPPQDVNYPHVTTLRVQNSDALPNDIRSLTDLYPSLSTLEITTSRSAVENRHEWDYPNVIEFPDELEDLCVNNALREEKQMVHLKLNTHWVRYFTVDHLFMTLIGPDRAVDCLNTLKLLTTLTIGMHMLRSSLETHDDAGDFLDPDVLAPHLETLTLFYCSECFSSPWDGDSVERSQEKFMTALNFVSKTAAARAAGKFRQLKEVVFVSQTPAWLVPDIPAIVRQESTGDQDGQEWYPGLFAAATDSFKKNGVRFKAIQSDEYNCRAPHMV